MNAILESLKIMERATRPKVEPGLCPECGSNNLQHELGFLMREEWTEFIEHKFLDEPGWYRCENGHEFKTKYNESTDSIEII